MQNQSKHIKTCNYLVIFLSFSSNTFCSWSFWTQCLRVCPWGVDDLRRTPFKESSRPQILRSERHQRWTSKAQVFPIHRNHENPNYRPPRLPTSDKWPFLKCFFFRCLSVPPKSWGPEGFMHRMVQRLLEGETTVLQLFASPLGWLKHMLATHMRAPKTWNFLVKKLGEDFLRWEFQLVQFFRGENFLVCMISETRHDFSKNVVSFLKTVARLRNPFPEPPQQVRVRA